MVKKERCTYCGVRIYRDRDMCPNCREKLKLIRKIRGIVFEMKRLAQWEALNDQGRN